MAAKLEPLLTIADIDSMPEDGNRYELIEGELFVSRAPSLIHQGTVRNVLFLFTQYLRENPVGQIFPGPGVIFSDFSGVIPDLVYFSYERGKEIATGDRITGAPELIIEILSPGTENRRRDEHAKRHLYKKYRVKEYWILDPQRLTVQIFRTARLKLIATLGGSDVLSTPLLPGFRCSVKEIFQ
jgi:Uma2 family endonuclease